MRTRPLSSRLMLHAASEEKLKAAEIKLEVINESIANNELNLPVLLQHGLGN